MNLKRVRHVNVACDKIEKPPSLILLSKNFTEKRADFMIDF